MCTLFLLTALVSTGRTSKQIFDSSGKNIYARVCNVWVSRINATIFLDTLNSFTKPNKLKKLFGGKMIGLGMK